MAYIAYLSVDGETFRIEGTSHCNDRAIERDYFDSDFVVGRLETLFGREDFVDDILNGIRMGDKFIIRDEIIGMDIAVDYAYDKFDAMDVLTSITTRCKLRVGNGQKVLRVLKDKVCLGIWNNATKRLEVSEW